MTGQKDYSKSYKVEVYQKFDDVTKTPFWANILQDLGTRWEITYENKNKLQVTRNVAKACCSTEPKKTRIRKKKDGN